MYAVKAVLSYPIWKGQLQAGTEDSFSRRTDNYSVEGIDIPASKATVKEDNIAGFATYGFYIPQVGQFSAGVRYEWVHYAYADAVTPANNITRDYGNWFPNVSYAGVIGQKTKNPVQVMLNYSAKTSRPKPAGRIMGICPVRYAITADTSGRAAMPSCSRSCPIISAFPPCGSSLR